MTKQASRSRIVSRLLPTALVDEVMIGWLLLL